MDIHNFITKLQVLPDKQKKIILWTIVAVLVIVMGYFWIRGTMNSLQKIGESVNQINPPQIELSKIEIPIN